jgi:Tol biopolymer transport system component/DNA-binding winged helix-turn-helix (wHTH) protein
VVDWLGMRQTETSGSIYRFAAFELDPRARELRKHGTRIKLQDQPLEILLLLLEQAGDVVTREQIQNRLWPAGTYVDYDNAINSAVRKLREALGDTSVNARFIETFARRGYRFTGNIERPPALEQAPEPTLVPMTPDGLLAQPEALSRRKLSTRVAKIAAGAFLVISIAAGWWLRSHRETKAETLMPLPLTSATGWEHAPSFSPDGDQIAYTWDGGEKPESSGIYVMRIGSGKPLRITGMATAKNSPPSPDGSPAWSPDGRMIAFLRSPDTAGGIYVVPPLGGLERKVVEGSFSGRIGWSPDGSHVAVAVVDAYWSSSLYLVAVATGEKFRLTAPPGSKWEDRDPAFSPNGRDLVFARCEMGVRCALYLLRFGANYRPVDGIRRLTQEGGSLGGVAWTADGTEVVYGFSNHLEKIRIEAGAQPQRVTLAVNSALDPAVAPRGNRLAFVTGMSDIDMWNIQPGKSPRRFASSTQAEYNPQFSPDGTRVVFSSSRSGVMQIWACDSDGGNPIQLTDFDTGPSGSPRWSPDGRWIAFDQQSKQGWRLFVMAADGGQVRKVTTDEEEEIIPSWSGDGKRIYYSSNRTGRSEIWHVPARGGKGTQFTHNGGIVAFGSLDRHTMYFTKHSQNLTDVWEIPMEGGEEKRVLQSVWGRSVIVVDEGIYYIPDFRPDNSSRSIRFHRFATSENVDIAPIKLRPFGGMTVSPDRKTILVSGFTSYGGNLMVVDNFR